jgi:hypothetical protein
MKKDISKLELCKAHIKNFLRGDFLRAKKLTKIAEIALLIAKRYKINSLYFITKNSKRYKADLSFLRRFKLLSEAYIVDEIDDAIKNSVVVLDFFDKGDENSFYRLYNQNNILIVYCEKKCSGFMDKLSVEPLFKGVADNHKYIYIFDKLVTDAAENNKINKLKIQAIVSCYNEEDIIGHTIQYLVNQGIYVHVIDNWSTDSSISIINEFVKKTKLVTSEKFPIDGPSKTYDWGNILNRVQTVAMDNCDRFDWFVHHDADEVRETPFKNISSLRSGIEIVNECGFNVVNHTVINFALTKDGFDGTQKLNKWFEYFEFGKKKNFHHKQLKMWKSNKKIDLVSSGGHIARFENMKVFPYNFLLKHYPLRSVNQAQKKIFQERKNRWNEKEKKEKEWHKQYDDIDSNYNFLQPKNKFIKYNRKNFYNKYLITAVFGVDE